MTDLILDLRIYRLKPGAKDAFAARFREQIGPMLRRQGIAVVHFGPSLTNPDSFSLVRSFSSLQKREEQLDAFYGSAEWLEQHDEAVMAMIDSYNVCVVEAAELGNMNDT